MSAHSKGADSVPGPTDFDRAQVGHFPSDPDEVDALLAERLAGFEEDLRAEIIDAGQRYFVEANEAGEATLRDVHTNEILACPPVSGRWRHGTS